jgi:hypothetical protein
MGPVEGCAYHHRVTLTTVNQSQMAAHNSFVDISTILTAIRERAIETTVGRCAHGFRHKLNAALAAFR